MAAPFTQIDTSSRFGAQNRQASEDVRSLIGKIEVLFQVGTNCVDGSDYSKLEATLGIPTGLGSAYFTTLTNVRTSLQAAAVLNFAYKLG